MDRCEECPRRCGIDRHMTNGFCGAGAELSVAHVMRHYWEEPPISGKNGSGTVFFSGCSLRCCFCQNHDITVCGSGRNVSPDELADIFFSLRDQGAHNINLVTPSHFTRELIPVLTRVRKEGLGIPVLWNSSGYELPETLRMLEGLVDIYLPDFKFIRRETAQAYSHAPDYPETAKAALTEMLRQQPERVFEKESGMMLRGGQVRHLILPGHAQESREILWYLHSTWGSRIGISIMQQYTPMPQCADDPLLCRRVTEHEYESVVRYAEQIGITDAFTQEREAASESFIPPFSPT